MHVMSHDTSLSHVPPPTVTFAKNEPATAGTGGGGDGDGGGVSVPVPSGGGGDGDGGGEPYVPGGGGDGDGGGGVYPLTGSGTMNVAVASVLEGSVYGPLTIPLPKLMLRLVPVQPSPNESCIVRVQMSFAQKLPVYVSTPEVAAAPSAILPGRPVHEISQVTSAAYVPLLTVIVALKVPVGAGGGGDGDGGGGVSVAGGKGKGGSAPQLPGSRGPQSAQSSHAVHAANSAPAPPSSHTPSEA